MSAGVSEWPARARRLTLRDGRILGWAEWGAPSGAPVVYLHGSLGSRLERPLEDAACRVSGVRLITVDRPGHGISDPHEGAGVAAFASDVCELADALELERVGVLGYSAGGIYALAFAAACASRVAAVAVVSGLVPAARARDRALVAPRVRRTMRHALRHQRLLRFEMRVHALAFRYAPDYAFRSLGDERITSDPRFRARFLESMREGARHGSAGFARDLGAVAMGWDFDLADVSSPVRWWHGTRDRATPPARAQELVDALPDAELTLLAGHGHLAVYGCVEEVLADLVERMGRAAVGDI